MLCCFFFRIGNPTSIDKIAVSANGSSTFLVKMHLILLEYVYVVQHIAYAFLRIALHKFYKDRRCRSCCCRVRFALWYDTAFCRLILRKLLLTIVFRLHFHVYYIAMLKVWVVTFIFHIYVFMYNLWSSWEGYYMKHMCILILSPQFSGNANTLSYINF